MRVCASTSQGMPGNAVARSYTLTIAIVVDDDVFCTHAGHIPSTKYSDQVRLVLWSGLSYIRGGAPRRRHSKHLADTRPYRSKSLTGNKKYLKTGPCDRSGRCVNTAR